MKFVLALSVIALVLVSGCSYRGQSPQTQASAQQAEPLPLPDKCPPTERREGKGCPDNFDKAGVMVADGSRYVYDETAKAWKYLSSEDMKAKYKETWEATKKTAGEAWDAAKDEYNKRK